MERFLILGGSGFIGTNVVEFLANTGKYEVLNIDHATPKNPQHNSLWKKVDICNAQQLKQAIHEFNPHYVLHLAARTDLMGKSVEEYSANTDGVEHLLQALDELTQLKRVVFTSSMLVCKVGYQPTHEQDYAPSTFYGESKVITEKIIRKHNPSYEWAIIRPTSIWGPWFGVPYANFFKMVLSHTYVNLGKHACTKTYGYIDNAIYQIMAIFSAEAKNIHQRMFYIGDYEPYNISDWAKEIGKEAGIFIPTVPFFLLRLAAWTGDILSKVKIPFPMTSFRLGNMTTDNVIDTRATEAIAPNLPVSRREGIITTIEWLKNNK